MLRSRTSPRSPSLPSSTSDGDKKKSFKLNISSRDLIVFVGGLLLGMGILKFTSPSSSTSTIGTTVASSSTSTRSVDEEGWGAINVFYGRRRHLYKEIPEGYLSKPEYFAADDNAAAAAAAASKKADGENNNNNNNENDKKAPPQWLAQHGQDIAAAVFHEFKRNGFFVDLAANDAIWASNTFVLEEHYDWNGICIEPNSFYWYRLSHRKCTKVGAFIGAFDKEVEVIMGNKKGNAPFGGIIGHEFDNKKAKKELTDIRYTVPLTDILDRHQAPAVIDYLSLDVEGAETFILRDFDFSKYTFQILSVERPKDELLQILQNAGYKHMIDFKRGDTLWAHESVYEAGKRRVEQRMVEINDKKMYVA